MKSSCHFFFHHSGLCPKLRSTNQFSLQSHLHSLFSLPSPISLQADSLYIDTAQTTQKTVLLLCGADHTENTLLLLLPVLLCYLAMSCNILPQKTQLPLLRVGKYLWSRCLEMCQNIVDTL
jgi:hypothetical protein